MTKIILDIISKSNYFIEHNLKKTNTIVLKKDLKTSSSLFNNC